MDNFSSTYQAKRRKIETSNDQGPFPEISLSYVGMIIPPDAHETYVEDNLRFYSRVINRPDDFTLLNLQQFIDLTYLKEKNALDYLKSLKDHEIFALLGSDPDSIKYTSREELVFKAMNIIKKTYF